MGKRAYLAGEDAWGAPQLARSLGNRPAWEVAVANQVGGTVGSAAASSSAGAEAPQELSDDELPLVPELSPEEAGVELVELLTELYFNGKLTAKHLCTLAWWAHKSGIASAKSLAFRPDAQSGHFRRHLDSVLLGGLVVVSKLIFL